MCIYFLFFNIMYESIITCVLYIYIYTVPTYVVANSANSAPVLCRTAHAMRQAF